jgi:hypothetical protein
MYRRITYLALLALAAVKNVSSSSPVQFELALAGLLNEKSKPTTEDFDGLFRTLISTEDYKKMVASEIHPTDLPSLLEEFRSAPKVPVSSATSADGAAAGTGLSDAKGESKSDSIGLSPVGVELSEIEASKPRVRFAPRMDAKGDYTVVARAESEPADESVGIKARTAAAAPSSDVVDPAKAQLESTKYIITTIDTLSHILVVLNAIEGDVNAGNYLTVIAKVDDECNYQLSKLADEAIDRIITNDDLACKWKKALRAVEAQVTQYTDAKPGPGTWPAFKAEVLEALTTLIDYAVVAKTNAEEMVVTAQPGDSNDVLEDKLQDAVVDTGCLCLRKCFYRVCDGSRRTTTPTPPPVAPGVVGPTSDRLKALRLAIFIDSTIATIQGIVKEVKELQSSGAAGEERLKNLKLRIALRLMSMLKQALANDVLDKVYDAIKNRSLYLLGTLSGVTASSGGWDTIKGAVSDTLNMIVTDLNASKPAVL